MFYIRQKQRVLFKNKRQIKGQEILFSVSIYRANIPLAYIFTDDEGLQINICICLSALQQLYSSLQMMDKLLTRKNTWLVKLTWRAVITEYTKPVQGVAKILDLQCLKMLMVLPHKNYIYPTLILNVQKMKEVRHGFCLLRTEHFLSSSCCSKTLFSLLSLLNRSVAFLNMSEIWRFISVLCQRYHANSISTC